MIDELIRQLQNPDPSVRKRAIIALGKAKNTDALHSLALVVRGDPDPELRELARKAGQYIRQQAKKSTRTPEDKELPTTRMLVRPNLPAKKEEPPPPPLTRRERKALEAQPQPPPPKKIVRPLDQEDMPETGALLGKKPGVQPISPPASPPAPPPAPQKTLLADLTSLDGAPGEIPVTPKPAPEATPEATPEPSENLTVTEGETNFIVSPFGDISIDDESLYMPPSRGEAFRFEDDEDESPSAPSFASTVSAEPYSPAASFSFDDEVNPPKNTSSSSSSASIIDDEPDFPTDVDDDQPIEPLRAPPLYYEKQPEPVKEDDQPLVKGSSLVKGRKYTVTPQNENRAREYLNAALSYNLENDNAKAMKNLTEAISLNPNLINDAFFSNVATSITGLEGDSAVQMIVDRDQRKQFTDNAVRKQKDQRVEKHLTEARQSGWADVWFEVGLFAVVVIAGTIVAAIVANEATKQLLANFAQISKTAPESLQALQTSLSNMSMASLLPNAIISGIITVLTLLLQTVLIHFMSKMMGGVGTWRHLVQVLLSFYNRWTWLVFVILCVTIYLGIATFSPVAICPTILLLGLTLYITGKTSSKVGEAYDFGGAKGCLTVTFSSIVIFLMNLAVFYVLFQSVGLAATRTAG